MAYAAVGVTSEWRNQNVHPDDRERIVTGLQARVQRNEDFWSGEYRFRRADGSYADIFDRGYILRDHNGRATRMIGSMMDVTKRKREMELADIRSVEVSQRFVQRLIGLGDVTIASAASADYAIRLHDIRSPEPAAETIRLARLKRLA